ncbi:metallophosphoesterase [Hyalangium rubrum]|uniref:Metallophosphoesterase n=1 Tax=Hyalangium rubrum TaxID=3103134 RepID=A0ABU5GVU4_9BACT|nr:metallophosphoesterase [Hyalangium sp. s54d21]MDY7225306.1 metallophosphoesterase [Hyalangium sp. s54d21]
MHLAKVPALGALALALTLTTGAAHAATLTRTPYLQRVGPDTATVAFRLDTNCSPEVRYGINGATNLVARSQASGRVHAVVLTGLTPGAEYTYLVEGCGAKTEPKRFSTAPVPGTRKVRFAAVGDFGTGGKSQKEVAAAMLTQQPELFVALGDNAYSSGTEAEIQNNLFAPMAALLAEVPFFAVAGNHEYVTNASQPYLDNLYLPTSPSGGERYYSFDWGHVHFVGLDSSCAIGLASKDLCTLEAQKKWVEADLAASTADWKVVYFHHPPWSSGEHGSQLLMRREFGPLFERYGVDLVLTGHDHNYERSHPMLGNDRAPSGQRGVPYLVVGGGGASLRAFSASQPAWSAKRNNTDFGFLDVTVIEGTLTAQLRTPKGGVIDSFTLTKQLAPREDPPPAAKLSIDVEGERGNAPHQAFFLATPPSSDTTVSWDFGDGQSAEGTQVTHLYNEPGQYTVTATASNGDTATTQVAVAEADTGEVPTTPGTPVTGTPQPSPGPSQGTNPPLSDEGGASAGCATVPMGALLPLGALALAGLLRRRRR